MPDPTIPDSLRAVVTTAAQEYHAGLMDAYHQGARDAFTAAIEGIVGGFPAGTRMTVEDVLIVLQGMRAVAEGQHHA